MCLVWSCWTTVIASIDTKCRLEHSAFRQATSPAVMATLKRRWQFLSCCLETAKAVVLSASCCMLHHVSLMWRVLGTAISCASRGRTRRYPCAGTHGAGIGCCRGHCRPLHAPAASGCCCSRLAVLSPGWPIHCAPPLRCLSAVLRNALSALVSRQMRLSISCRVAGRSALVAVDVLCMTA